MSLLSSFFLGPSYLVQYDCLEITHPNFVNTSGWRVVRNAIPGVEVDHESGGGTFFYDYYPMSIKPVGSTADLGQSLSVTFGDLGVIIGDEIRAINEANAMNVRPTAKFRTYRSDNLGEPMSGPLVLEVVKVTTNEEGCTLECAAPNVNATRTGVQYTVEQFPMLRPFVS
jgi:hypothetical protein